MKENKMAEAIGRVDDKYLNEAINYKPKKKMNYTGIMGLVALAACLFLVLGVGLIKSGNKAETVDSVVSIDINPSIELKVSKHNKVLSAVALNEDAKIVLEGMDLKNVDLDTALNAIIGSLLKNGYLDEVYNAVNVCVENDDTERASELGEKVTSEISSIFDENDLIGGVNTQLCPSSDDAKKLADSYGISVGKLGLAQQVAENVGISLEVAVKLSISELWELLEAEGVKLISKDEALKLAVEDAKVEADEITLINNKIKEAGGVFIYDIKFEVGENEVYKYKVDAVEGVILEREYKYVSKEETSDSENPSTEESTEGATEETTKTPPVPVKQITKKEALAIAYKDAGVEEKNVELEELKHKPVEKEYHIEFTDGSYDYVYVINGVDGSILNKEVEEKISTDEIKPESVISVDKALNIALEKAGVKLSDLTKCDIKYTNKKTSAEYKIHFHVDKAHYDYTVNAVTGEIVEKTHPTPGLPHEKEETTKPTPVLPHEKEEATKPAPVLPHEKETVTPPGPLAKKEPHTKPAGPADTKITISFEKTTTK